MKVFRMGILAALLAAGGVLRGGAQNPDTLMPDQSAALARKILGQLTEAMGGPAYLGVRESECSGRLSQFGHNSDLTEYIEFKDYWHYPDKNRTDYAKKGNIIDLFSGNEGWTLDRSGVSPQPAAAVAEFQEQVKRDIDNLLRLRLKEEGMTFRYAGLDLIDMHPVDWVELVDREDRTYRLAVQRDNHLLVRSQVIIRDETTRERTVETTFYSNYHLQDGVQTPLQIARERDGRRVFQAFFNGCRYNPNFPSDFFTRAALEKRYEEVASKKDRERAAKQRQDRD